MIKLKKVIALCLSMVMLVSMLPAAAAEDLRLIISDDYIQISVYKENGRFAARTTSGDPLRESDTDKPLLYEKGIPETSFSSFRIGGDDIIFGNDYGVDAHFIQKPTATENAIITVWQYKELEITQTITLVADDISISTGNAKVSYVVKNTGLTTQNVGNRILLDTQTGDNDGSILRCPTDYTPIEGERAFGGETLPVYWYSQDNEDDPKVISYGMLYGWGEASPNRVIFGHWSGLSSTKWDYKVDNWTNYHIADNKYKTADSAVAIYFNQVGITSQSTYSFSTCIGMGSKKKQAAPGDLGVSLSAPKKAIMFSEGGRNNCVDFSTSLLLDNSYESCKDIDGNIEVEVGYPNELELYPNLIDRVQIVPGMKKGESVTIPWNFRAQSLPEVNVFQLNVRVRIVPKLGMEGETKIIKETAYVLALNSFDQSKVPEMQFTFCSPDIMYVGDKNRVLVFEGNNFNYLRDFGGAWEVNAVAPGMSANRIPIEKVTVESNTRMLVTLPNTFGEQPLPTGTYGIEVIYNKDTVEGGGKIHRKPVAFTLSNDIKYQRRGYGTLVFANKTVSARDGIDGNIWYDVPFTEVFFAKGNNEVVLPDEFEETMRLNGDIQLIEGTANTMSAVYSVIPDATDPIYMANRLIKIEGDTDPETGAYTELIVTSEVSEEAEMDDNNMLLVDGDGNHIYPTVSKITNAGPCKMYINTAVHLGVQELSVGVTPDTTLVWTRPFEVNANDFTVTLLDFFGLSEDMKTCLGGFNLDIVQFKIERTKQRIGGVEKDSYAVVMSADLDLFSMLEMLYQDVADPEDKYKKKLAFVTCKVDGFIIYEDGHIEFIFQAGVGLPAIKTKNFSSKNAGNKGWESGMTSAYISINTVEDLYSFIFNVNLAGFETLDGDDDTRGFKVEAGLFLIDVGHDAFKVPMLDVLEISMNNETGVIQLGNIPVAINQLGGGVRGIHTIRDAIQYGKHTDLDANFYLMMGFNDTLSPLVQGSRMFNLKDCKVTVGTKEISLEGAALFYKIPLINPKLALYIYPLAGLGISSTTNILGVLDLEVAADIAFNYERLNFYAGGRGKGSMSVPGYVPVFGGFKLANAEASISTENVAASAQFLQNIYATAKYTWRTGTISFSSGNNLFSVEGLDESGEKVAMEYGTNTFPVKVTLSNNARQTKFLRLKDSANQILTNEASVIKSGEVMLFSDDYEEMDSTISLFESLPAGTTASIVSTGNDAIVTSGDYSGEVRPALTVKRPDGSDYPLIFEGENANALCFPLDNGKNRITVVIPEKDNVAGTWTFSSNIELTDFATLGILNTPVFEDVKIKPTLEGYTASLKLSNNKGINKIRLEAASESAANPTRFVITEGMEVTAAEMTKSFKMPENSISGNYRLIATVTTYDEDGDVVIANEMESNVFRYDNPNGLFAPRNVSVKEAGSRQIVEWDALPSDNITGYYVSAVDADGKIGSNVPVFDEDGETIIGYADPVFVPYQEGRERYSALIKSWTPEKDYKAVVYAVYEEAEAPIDIGEIIPSKTNILPGDRCKITWQNVVGHDKYSVKLYNQNSITGEKELITATDFTLTENYLEDILDFQSNVIGKQAALTLGGVTAQDNFVSEIRVLPNDDEYAAQNVDVTDLEVDSVYGESKQIEWDPVAIQDTHNIGSYEITATPKDMYKDFENSDTVHFSFNVPIGPAPARYEKTFDGFNKEIEYDFVIRATHRPAPAPVVVYGEASDAVDISIGVFDPPPFEVMFSTPGFDQTEYFELMPEKPTLFDAEPVIRSFDHYKTNVNELKVAISARNDANSLLVTVNGRDAAHYPDFSAEAPGDIELALKDGVNEVKFKVSNKGHELREKTCYITVKSSAPTLMVKSTEISNDIATITVISDAGVSATVNGDAVWVDENGEFSYSVPLENRAVVEFEINVYDSYNNSNHHVEKVINDTLGKLVRVEIQTTDTMYLGDRQKLLLYAYDENDKSVIVPNDYVEWNIDQGISLMSEDAQGLGMISSDGEFLALMEGPCVITASFSIGGDGEELTDTTLVQIDPFLFDIDIPTLENGTFSITEVICDDEGNASALVTRLSETTSGNQFSLIFAVYDNMGSLLDLKIVESTEAILTGTPKRIGAKLIETANQNKIKVFAWDSFERMNPLAIQFGRLPE